MAERKSRRIAKKIKKAGRAGMAGRRLESVTFHVFSSYILNLPIPRRAHLCIVCLRLYYWYPQFDYIFLRNFRIGQWHSVKIPRETRPIWKLQISAMAPSKNGVSPIPTICDTAMIVPE